MIGELSVLLAKQLKAMMQDLFAIEEIFLGRKRDLLRFKH